MAGVELANLKASFVDGALVITDLDGNSILTINPSSGGLALANAGGLTISTGIIGSLTVSSGLTLDGVSARTVTGAATLTVADSGRIVNCAVDATIFTLPMASTTTLPGTTLTIRNNASTGGAQIVLITNTGETIVGGGISTTNLVANTKATADKGDYVIVQPTGSSGWRIVSLVGTWASTT